jgi:hypothetical protein
MISAVLAATVLFFQAAPAADHAATAAPPAAAPAPTPGKSVSPVTVTGKGSRTTAVDDPATIVCHDEKRLGSLFPTRVCARKDEIAMRQREDQAEHRRNTALRPWKDPAS